MNKKDLLSNLREYSTTDIVSAIKSGKVTMYELSKTGQMTPLMRKRIEKAMEGSQETAVSPSSDTPIQSPSPVPPKKQQVETAPSPAQKPQTEVAPVPPTGHIDRKEQTFIPEVIQIQQVASLDQLISNEGDVGSAQSSSNDSSRDTVVSNTALPVNRAFSRPFSFKGRIRRTEYALTFMVNLIWQVLSRIFCDDPYAPGALFAILFITYVPLYWLLLSEGCKRCHDRGNSGWYQLIPFYALVLLFGEGQKGSNKYGNNPKEI